MKKLIILLALLISSLPVLALDPTYKEVNVIHKDGKLIIAGNTCDLLNKEGVALAQWSSKLKEKTKDSPCSCKKGYCTKEVTELVPDFVQANHSQRNSVYGPNSFNAALHSSKILSQFRYASGTEMNFWMNSPLCRERGGDEPLAPGDLALIRSWKDGDLHGYVHVTNNLAFSKNGFDSGNPYYLQSPIALHDHNKIPEQCRKRSGTPKECPIWVNYFSCKTMDEYLKERPIKSSDAKKAYTQLTELECSIGEAVVNGKANPALRSFVIDNLVILNNMALDIIKSKKFLEEDKVIWQAIFHKTKSISGQLDYL